MLLVCQQGHNITCTAKANRSSEIFAKFLHKKPFLEFDTVMGCGDVEGIPFTAYSIKGSNGKVVNFLSTIDEDPQFIKQTKHSQEVTDMSLQGRRVPIASNRYFKNMGNVDQANKSIKKVAYPYKLYRWRVGVLLWIIGVMVHNAYVCYKLLTRKSITKKQFTEELAREFYVPACLEGHKLVSNAPKKNKCVICRKLFGSNSSTTLRCTCCGPVHKNCFRQFHDKYVLENITTGKRKKN